jgi:hypothetical protein
MQRSQCAYRATKICCDGMNENVNEILVFVVVISPLWSLRIVQFPGTFEISFPEFGIASLLFLSSSSSLFFYKLLELC